MRARTARCSITTISSPVSGNSRWCGGRWRRTYLERRAPVEWHEDARGRRHHSREPRFLSYAGHSATKRANVRHSGLEQSRKQHRGQRGFREEDCSRRESDWRAYFIARSLSWPCDRGRGRNHPKQRSGSRSGAADLSLHVSGGNPFLSRMGIFVRTAAEIRGRRSRRSKIRYMQWIAPRRFLT